MFSNYFSVPTANALNIEPLKAGTKVAGHLEVISDPYVGKRKIVYRVKVSKPHGREAILLLPVSNDKETKRLFLAEQALLDRISHPGLVIQLEHGSCRKHGLYTVLEFISGPTLAMAMRHERRLEPDRAIAIFSKICLPLHALHKNGLVHGGLKANHVILHCPLAGEEQPKLIDLSLSQAIGKARQLKPTEWVETFQSVGQPSPEELQGDCLSVGSDLYSLGCLLYKALTGKAPFNGTSAEEIRHKHLTEAPPPLQQAFPGRSFSPNLQACVMKALEKSPQDRYQNAEQLARELNQCQRHPSSKS